MLNKIRQFLLATRKRIVFSTIRNGYAPSLQYFEKYIEQTILKELLDELEVDCVLDVGANVGQFASDLRMIGFQGQIISFEPVREAFNQLTTAMGSDTRWRGCQLALGSEPGDVLINVGVDTVMSSILEFKEAGPAVGTEEIRVERLDHIWETLSFSSPEPKVFLKMDTQGFDHEVFEGSSGCLENIVGIMSEVSVIPLYENMINYRESLARFEDAGFRICNLSTVSRNAMREVVELNCLMRK